MSLLQNIVGGLRGLFGKERAEQELDEELRGYVEAAAEEKIKAGMSAGEAVRAARLELGGAESVKEEVRAAGWESFVEGFWQDLRFGVRMLRKSPGFTAMAVAILALGIGVNAAVFTLTKTAFFKGYPSIDGDDRLLYIRDVVTDHGYQGVSDGYTDNGDERSYFSFADFEDWRAQAKSFEEMGACIPSRVSLSDKNGFPENYGGTLISANTFRLIGQRPILGRDFAPFDEVPGAAPVAILTYSLWEQRYGKDPAIVGQTVRINGAPTTVIGVMPQGFGFPFGEELWIPLTPTPDLQKRETHRFGFAFGRMASGVTIRKTRAEMETIGRRLKSAYPLTNRSVLPVVRDFNEYWIGPRTTLIYEAMLGAVGFVLLIACANLANLMLAQAISRSREVSVRIVLGAGRWRIIRQFVIESLLLSGVGGFFGWWVAKLAIRVYDLQKWGSGTPYFLKDFPMDYRVLAYLMAISIGTGLLFGLVPARRLSKLDINGTLKDGGRGATGGGYGKRLSALLVVGEMALAVALLAGAGVMIRSFLNVYNADLDINAANILTAYLTNLPVAKYPSTASQISFYDRLKTRLEAIPGVESVAIANRLPLVDSSLSIPYELEDAPPVDQRQRPVLSALIVGSDYFRTLEVPIISGRVFNDRDGISGVPAAIVNQQFARQHWPGENPLGKRLRLFDGDTPEAWLTVIGVVPNIVQRRQEIDPLIYVPYKQKPVEGMSVFARTRVPPESLETAFRQESQLIDSDQSLEIQTLADALESDYRRVEISGVPFLIFAAIALLLASIGLYAVVAYSVSQRIQEIGIRMAIGATAHDIRELVFKQGMVPVGIGLIIGLTASLAITRVLKSELFQVSPTDPITLGVASAVLVFAAVLACLIPARRATRVDPMVALRHE